MALPKYETARSFEGLNPPAGAVEVGQQRKGAEVYIYYQTPDGETYYISKRQQNFEKEMLEKMKKH